MLKITNIYWEKKPIDTETGDDLFERNPTITFTINAPMYWWIEVEVPKYCFNMPLKDFEFCFDEFAEWYEGEHEPHFENLLSQSKVLPPRTIMQLLPMSTYITGIIELSYQEIIEKCENYRAGEYRYFAPFSFPTEREWTDFCETLLDLKGVRDLVKEDI